MIARVRCEKCGATGKFDLGDAVVTAEQAQAKLDAVKITNCPFGNHMEFSSIAYIVLDVEAGQAPTDVEWLAGLRADRDLWTLDELCRTEIVIQSFAYGMPLATVRGEDFWLDMTISPEGHRHYYAPRGVYELALAEPAPITGG